MFGTSNSHELSLIEPAEEQSQALQIFNHIPVGFVAFPMEDRSLEPLARPGEIIIADLNDREIQPGRIYLRRNVRKDGRARFCVDEVFTQKQRQRCDDSGWYMADAYYFVDHNRPKSLDDYPTWIARNRGYITLSDGPFYREYSDYWRSQEGTVVGRVVGILSITPNQPHCVG